MDDQPPCGVKSDFLPDIQDIKPDVHLLEQGHATAENFAPIKSPELYTSATVDEKKLQVVKKEIRCEFLQTVEDNIKMEVRFEDVQIFKDALKKDMSCEGLQTCEDDIKEKFSSKNIKSEEECISELKASIEDSEWRLHKDGTEANEDTHITIKLQQATSTKQVDLSCDLPGLRPPKEKVPRSQPLTNAQKCKAYRERIAVDQCRGAEAKTKKAVLNNIYYATLTPAQKEQRREQARLNQQRRRAFIKEAESQGESKSPKVKKEIEGTPLRHQVHKDSVKKEKNRLSQQKRRANMTPQAKSQELQKRRQLYAEKKFKQNPND